MCLFKVEVFFNSFWSIFCTFQVNGQDCYLKVKKKNLITRRILKDIEEENGSHHMREIDVLM